MTSSRDQLHEILQRQTRTSHELLAALECEFEALRLRDAQALEEAVVVKQERIDAVREATKAHAAFLSAHELPADDAGMRKYIDSLDTRHQGELTRLWDELHELAERLWERNRVNGQVIKLSHGMTEELLHTLRGEDMPANVYGPDGVIPIGGSTKPLAQA
jgi:flagellar biosynthesis/type III secretory pathway chaperone